MFSIQIVVLNFEATHSLVEIQHVLSRFQEKLSDDDEEDEDKYADDVIIPGQKFDSKR